MNLTELQGSKKIMSQRALREHFETNIDLERLDLPSTKKMLDKVRGLIKENNDNPNRHSMYGTPSYLKLSMMDQMLSQHYEDLKNQTSIVVENEEVQKSQVILSAQDMIDSIQKMMEQVSKMNVEELPAVVTGVQNEIGTNESEQFNQAVGQSLTTLLQALTTAKSELTSSMNQLTGVESSAEVAPEFDDEELDVDADLDMAGDEEVDSGEEMGPDLDLGAEEEEDEELGNIGREMR